MTRTPAHILIADDEHNIRLVLHAALATEGYSIEEVSNGRAALDVIAVRKPDLMILDLSMPELDGFARGNGGIRSMTEHADLTPGCRHIIQQRRHVVVVVDLETAGLRHGGIAAAPSAAPRNDRAPAPSPGRSSASDASELSSTGLR